MICTSCTIQASWSQTSNSMQQITNELLDTKGRTYFSSNRILTKETKISDISKSSNEISFEIGFQCCIKLLSAQNVWSRLTFRLTCAMIMLKLISIKHDTALYFHTSEISFCGMPFPAEFRLDYLIMPIISLILHSSA